MKSWTSRIAPPLVLLLGVAALAQAQTTTAGSTQARPIPAEVTVCLDPEPPPMGYWVRDEKGRPLKQLTGVGVEMARMAFERMGLQVRFIGDQPWARCVHSVSSGSIDFALGAFRDREREKRFAFSIPYFRTTPQVFYRTEFPLDIRSTADLARYRGCGMLGASYEHYDLRPEQLDLGVNQLPKLVEKLKAGRCDFFVEELELVRAFANRGLDVVGDPALRHAPVPGARAPGHHLMARRGGNAETLMPQFDRALTEVLRSGAGQRVWRLHSKEAVNDSNFPVPR